jgi:hypothetical protein
MGCCKKPIFRTAITGTLAMVQLGMVLVAEASAGCGSFEGYKAGAIRPLSWQGAGEFGPDLLLLVADRDGSVDRIVGFWKVTLVSKGTLGIPDGTLIDSGFAQWHSDGTEILNSSQRSPASSNFCLGIWKKTGKFHYTLNHFGLSWDTSTDKPLGPAQIYEEIELDHGADSYFGTFTIDQYDVSQGTVSVHITGTVTATRISVNTPLADVL